MVIDATPPSSAPRRTKRTILRIAQDTFSFDELEEEQKKALLSLLSGRDTLVILPTGSGKSAIYQISALLIPRSTIVVSPLLSLQQDQIHALQDLEVGGAASLNSTMTRSQQKETLESVKRGETEFLFLSPEQFHNEEKLRSLQEARPSLFVVDEAH